MSTSVPRVMLGQTVDPNTGICHKPIVEWLLTEGWVAADSAQLLKGLGERLLRAGFPLARISVLVQSLHPEAIAIRYVWRRETGQVETWSLPHGAEKAGACRDGPITAVNEPAAGVVRRRPETTPHFLDYSILKDILEAGAADAVSRPLVFSDGTIHAITFVADRPGGFVGAELDDIDGLTMVLARLLEVHAVRRTVRDLMDTYLGKHTGERVLRGLVRRGDGEDIHAAIWFCDLRDSTAMAESMPRSKFLGVLNDFFDCVAGAVLDQGGEVLRYIGDAVLAIFPTGTSSCDVRRQCCDEVTSCHSAIDAAKDAKSRMKALNRKRALLGEPALRYGLALHMGDVTYGNIGVPGRLEFTVIGAAANEAARMESLCRTLNRPLLISSEFKRCFPGELISLGFHELRGVGSAVEIFTLPEAEA